MFQFLGITLGEYSFVLKSLFLRHFLLSIFWLLFLAHSVQMPRSLNCKGTIWRVARGYFINIIRFEFSKAQLVTMDGAFLCELFEK